MSVVEMSTCPDQGTWSSALVLQAKPGSLSGLGTGTEHRVLDWGGGSYSSNSVSN